MAKMRKRISNNALRTKKANEPTRRPKKNYGKDYWLIAMIAINLLLILTSLPLISVQPVSFGASVFLEILLVNMYVLRHYNFAENVEMWLNRFQYGGIIVLVILFGISLYQRYA